MEDVRYRNILGVLGGMGPLASAEFVKTIYDYCLGEHEQLSPTVILYSDPSLPDRTETLLGQAHDALLQGLIKGMNRLCEAGASRIVICCVTAHYLLWKLPPHLSEKVISLLDVISSSVAQTKKSHLLICTTGARHLGLFQDHREWDRIKEFVVWPDDSDQTRIHSDLLYRIKKKSSLDNVADSVESLLRKYHLDSFIAGCTEMHLVAKHLASRADSRKRYGCIDPLTIIARDMTLGSVWSSDPQKQEPSCAGVGEPGRRLASED